MFFLFYYISRIPGIVPHIPTLIPRIPTLIPIIPSLIPPIPIIFTLISGISSLIPPIPAPILLIPIIPTLIPCIPIIPLILFPDFPFQLLQIADFSNVLVKTVLLDSSWGKKRIFEKNMFGFEKGYVFSISIGERGML